MSDDRFPIFKRTITGLVPASEAADEALRGLPIGYQVVATLKRPRNPAHHNKYFALISRVAAALGKRTEEVHYVVKLRSGFAVPIETKSGTVYMVDSIRWSKMDQAVFETFYQRALAVICEEWLPHLKPGQLRDEIEQLAA